MHRGRDMVLPSVVDAHHHIWAPDTDPEGVGWVWLKKSGRRQFGDPAPIQRDYLLPEFLNEAAPDRVAGSVHVQVDNSLSDPVAETRFIQKISDSACFPIMIVGFVNLAAPELDDLLDRHMAYSNFRGIRQIIARQEDRPEISFAPRDYLRDLGWRAGFASLGARGLSFDLQLYPEQMQAAAEFLAGHPEVPVAIDHLGSPYDLSAAGAARWRRGMAALAALDHVHVKLSGYAMYFGTDMGQGARDLTAEIIDLFGANRTMFGSNFPVDKLHLLYRDAFELIADVAPDDLPQILGGTARRFYRF
ncbi:Predicted metal-dependent hydrolase, TIM-barrel fold [Roseovarius nanhaiticus]|uniref:Predicted metal-dependent hydrolase, TIM-barrel fold n=2 Tax=Roseovarius nanhaiticus TaxID=573024 RepID=A0A1N7HNF0_9RHOB|nr:Predicted metal-dependent hydrolase, TIM-barrel fold [Roseovarius nanhaiticus]SIS26238.1 Predicted metal-dependent hydrolase, TIM-barrel fold [Roseovarius nanhaiticus]